MRHWTRLFFLSPAFALAAGCGARTNLGVGPIGTGATGGSSFGGSVSAGGTSGVGGGVSFGGTGGAGGSVTSGAGGGAGTGGGPSSCCYPRKNTAGCNDPRIATCVCAADAYCCESAWDAACVNEVESLGCGACGGTGFGGGAGFGGSAGGGGGTGGIQQCVSQATTQCDQCACQSCYASYETCTSSAGCQAIAACIEKTGCSGRDCFHYDTCRSVIYQNGGRSTFHEAETLTQCLGEASCPCP